MLTSPGRRDQLPPPTRETMDAWWCGARTGLVRATLRRAMPAGRRVNAGDRECLGGRQRWEYPDHALSEHRLARPWRPDHEEVVATGRGDLTARRPTAWRPASQIGWGGGGVGSGRWRGTGPAGFAAQDADQIGQRGRAMGVLAAHEGGLPHVTEVRPGQWARQQRRPGRSCPGRGVTTR